MIKLKFKILENILCVNDIVDRKLLDKYLYDKEIIFEYLLK